MPGSSYIFDTLVLAFTFAIFYKGGSIFFQTQLAKTFNARNRIVQTIFAITFGLSCSLFELVIFEILDIMNIKFALKGN